ncbi:hypothetical protein RLW55_14875 [Hyphomicrobium sp. B1]|uniref:hypothetical protein n=1 Tax=Hyphomicrobium sp. B1 TaxID=3075651 RepID=UPI003C2ABCF5
MNLRCQKDRRLFRRMPIRSDDCFKLTIRLIASRADQLKPRQLRQQYSIAARAVLSVTPLGVGAAQLYCSIFFVAAGWLQAKKAVTGRIV